MVFGSPPCKGYSGLLSKKHAARERYQALNALALQWVRLVLETWGDEPPRLILFENVPRIASRGRVFLDQVRALLEAAGYVFHESTHDCGELGGLAQHRRRFLLVARHPGRCDALLYEPPKKRVRACGEVLGELPMPGAPEAGKLHALPRLQWRNWVRLALIPAGGDWRDLPGVLAEGQARREVHKRHEVSRWDTPTGTIAGSGSNSVGNVSDPRPAAWYTAAPGGVGPRAFHPEDVYVKRAYDHGYRVLDWREASFTIHGQTSPGCGAYQVADPRDPSGVEAGRPYLLDDLLRAWPGAPTARPDFVPVIIAEDGTWHRPMTTLELARLQGLPPVVGGAPLGLAGTITRIRERIGNAVPVPTARAIGRQMLKTLYNSVAGVFTLQSRDTPVWVEPDGFEEILEVAQ